MKTASNLLITLALLATFPVLIVIAVVRTVLALTLAWGTSMLDVWE